jgi:hypothetical protein
MKNHLVHISKIKEHKRILRPISDDDLLDALDTASNVHLHTILGTSLFDSLTSKITSSGATFNAAEITLVQEKIAPCLAEYTLYEYLGYGNYQVSNKGVMKSTNANFSAVESQELNNMRTLVKGVAEHYGSMLVQYLCDNQSLFPLYNQGNEDIEPLDGDDYNIGIW